MEFALLAPVLLLIVFATIEYGWYLTQCMVTSNAVAEGARAAVKAREWEAETHGVEDPEKFARTAVKEAMWGVKELTGDCIKAEVLKASENGPRRIKVSVEDLPYKPITGFLGETMLPQVLAAKAVMAFP